MVRCGTARRLAVRATTGPFERPPDAGGTNMTIGNAMRALANAKRLQVLEWLKNPRAHFPPQVDGDLVRDGVCGLLIARKLKVSQPTASEHMRVLVQCGVVRPTRIKQWTFYKRDERRIQALKKDIANRL